MTTKKRKAGERKEESKKKRTKVVVVPDKVWSVDAVGRPEGVELDTKAIDSARATEIFKELHALPFVRLPVRGQKFKRSKVMYVDISDDGKIGSLYRFPYGNDGAQKVDYKALKDAPKVLLELRDKHAPGSNNVIVTLYPHGKAGIGPHSDNRANQYTDMVPTKPIVDLVFMETPTEVRPLCYQLDAVVVPAKSDGGGAMEDEEEEGEGDGDGKQEKQVPDVWALAAGHGSKVTSFIAF
jgi:hypothetical protein